MKQDVFPTHLGAYRAPPCARHIVKAVLHEEMHELMSETSSVHTTASQKATHSDFSDCHSSKMDNTVLSMLPFMYFPKLSLDFCLSSLGNNCFCMFQEG